MEFDWGGLINALSVLIGLFLAVYAPLKKVAEKLAKIETKLDSIDQTLNGHNKLLNKHEEVLNEHETKIAVNTEQIKELKENRKND